MQALFISHQTPLESEFKHPDSHQHGSSLKARVQIFQAKCKAVSNMSSMESRKGYQDLQSKLGLQRPNGRFVYLKKFQGGRFLVGSDTVKPEVRLALNGHEILIVEHQDRKPFQKPLVAGTLKSTEPGRDPFTLDGGDPWQKWPRPTGYGTSRPANVWANYRPSNDAPMTEGDAPGSSGDPSEHILKQQSERITSIEAKMQSLEARLADGQDSNDQKFAKVEEKICGIEQSLRGSLKEALSQQSEQLLATFESLLKRSPRTKDIKRDRTDRSNSRSPRGGSG